MTTASFATDGSRIVSFTVEGHSGLAESGEDILCAAVTSAVRLTECAINDVLGLEAAVKVSERDASISLKLPRNLEGEADQVCQTLLAALMLYFVQLQEEYPQHIIVMEV
ncbi:MAG: ribosomal-processing cysteine protease Prp [Clostridiales bacterium]|uniref:ribosomal-processing cysteine protease Prp n=1 Tax=Evtepia sp. TaxID=2773933 RepID=UPI002983657B|nr:ribosomal-processing cysteine protease Prp [Evtepia sp.]MDD7289520.1 ribosomal-processing cysteine protease Prp [Clostridiales bacterium]MDY3992290.1 ribosomal-processing cysteine protease Prp [Evtepia sp.]MDY4431034.1 ribosomal-processing cysteine protease Prp [Evtepia sp.]